MGEVGTPEGLLGTSGLQFPRAVHGPRNITDAVFLYLVVTRELRHLRYAQVATDDDAVQVASAFGEVLVADTTPHSRECLLELAEGQVALVRSQLGDVSLNLAAPTSSALKTGLQRLIEALRPPTEDPAMAWINYWALDPSNGPQSAARRARIPEWQEVLGAYSPDVNEAMASLLATERPDHARLILWHGVPGTGKTNAVRALVRGWAEWCVPHFITDPEEFLGASSYLLRVLTAGDPDDARSREWRLVILEDAGELLAIDAHERTGQALSRLLNATDGLLAQTANTLVLVTTNEPIGMLHPGLVRQGRCLAEIEFGPLPVEEANAWLEARGTTVRVSCETTIAELHAIATGRASPRRKRQVGFAA